MKDFSEWEKKFRTPNGIDFSNATHAEHLAWVILNSLVHYSDRTCDDIVKAIDNFFDNLPEE
jgi:hypothetical protein